VGGIYKSDKYKMRTNNSCGPILAPTTGEARGGQHSVRVGPTGSGSRRPIRTGNGPGGPEGPDIWRRDQGTLA
jgi:hypothetical protein